MPVRSSSTEEVVRISLEMKMETYDIAAGWKDMSAGEQERVINLAAIGELEKWSSDPA